MALIDTSFRDLMQIPIADAYHEASLAGAAMRQLADGIEAFVEVLTPTRILQSAWDELDDAVGRAFELPHLAALVRLRQRFREGVIQAAGLELRQALASDAATGSRVYLSSYARALGSWRRDLFDALARETFVAHPDHVAAVEAVRSMNHLVGEERWSEAYPLFLMLAGLDFVASPDRARLLTTAAQIRLYHIKVGVGTDELLDRARTLAPDEPRINVVRGECALERDDDAMACELGENVLRSDPGHVGALILMSRCARKDHILAEKWARDAIRAHPGDSLGYRRLIDVAGAAPAKALLDEVPDLVERARTVEPTEERGILLDAGYAMQQQSEFDHALDYFRRAREKDPHVIDSYIAEAYLLIDQRKGSEAREVLESAVKRFPASPDPWRALAIIAEMESNWRAAEDFYRNVISHLSEPTPLDFAKPAHMVWKQGRREEGESELVLILQRYPADEAALQVAERIIDILVDQEEAAEAKRYCDRVAAAIGEPGRAWHENKIGDIHFTLAEYPEAIARYREACRLAPESVPYATELVRAYRNSQSWDASRDLWTSASPSVQRDQSFRDEMALLRNDEANFMFERSAYAQAIPLYQEAVERSPSDAVLWSNLADAWERNTTVAAMNRLDEALAALRRATEINPGNQAYRDRDRRIENLRSRIRQFGDQILNLSPILTAVGLEVASDLVPLVKGVGDSLSEECAHLFSRMRDDLLATYGLHVPGVRVRGDEGILPAGSYIIMLMDVPIVMGSVTRDRRAARASVQELKKLGVAADYVADPCCGEEMGWVAEPDWPVVIGAKVELWSVMEYAVRHVQSVLARNLADFLDHQQASTLLQKCDEDVVRRITASPGGLTALTCVLRALLQERVPITALESIVPCVAGHLESGLSRLAIVEEIRRLPEVRPGLPGNRSGIALLHAGRDLTARLREGLIVDHDRTVLAMEPESCQHVLSAVRDRVGSHSAALIVDDADVRALARCLFELEFPDLAVLSRAELLPDLATRPLTEIDMER